MPVSRPFAGLLSGVLMLAACSPTLDWREVRPGGSELVALLPCKPERTTRALELAGAQVQFELLACSAAGATWAVASADVGEAARVAAALESLRVARIANLDGRETETAPFQPRGGVALAGAGRFTVVGRRPEGAAVVEHSAVFARGTRVFHAAAIGAAPGTPAVESFFEGLEFRR
jgi:hypothetical protein